MKMNLKKIDLSKYEKPSRFIKWKQGDNRIRVTDSPYMYQVVGKRTARGYVRQVLEDGVEVKTFLKDAVPKLTYGFVVYSHEDAHFHVIESGVMLGDALTKLIQEKQPDEFKKTDIIVAVAGEKLDRTYACKWAEETTPLPDGANRDSAEFKYIKSYFEGL